MARNDVSSGRNAVSSLRGAKRSRLFSEVFYERSLAMRKLVFAPNLLETGDIVVSESRERVGYSILSADLPPPALRRLHSVISDVRPPSATESGEAALRRLLASRDSGCHSLTSEDPVPGSLTVFQSTRVAPLDASKATLFGSLLGSSARSYSDAHKQRTLRLVSDIAVVVVRLGPGGLYVDSVFQYTRRHCVGFVRDLVKANSVDFVEDAVEHVGLYFFVKEAGAPRFIVDARANNRHR